MTFAAIPLLQREPAGNVDFAAAWLPALFSKAYDGNDAPLSCKRSVVLGMGMTEKQGGSDVRAVITRAVSVGIGGRGAAYLLTSDKWFFSAPQADAHLVLAQTAEGPSCFFVLRWIPNGPRNVVRVQRLKDKLGNCSNASDEMEFDQAWGMLLGEPGRGLALLLKRAASTRLDCVLGSAALIRQALVQAAHHTCYRYAFGKPLVDHAVMQNVLADLALESEAATILALRLARLVDERADPVAKGLARIGTPAAKLWVCKRAITMVAECMEVLGGNGYIEEGPMARLYREAPVNSILERSGNVMALDVLRAMQRESDALNVLITEFESVGSNHAAYDLALDQRCRLVKNLDDAEQHARQIAAGVGAAMAGGLIDRLRASPTPLSPAACLHARVLAASSH